MLRLAATLAGIAVLTGPVTTSAASAPDAGRPFAVPDPGPGRYAVRPGSEVRVVEAADGTPLHTETWLPAPKDGAVPPTRLPVVVQYSPYSAAGSPENPRRMESLVTHGYAYTEAHVRGSGASGGCIEQTAGHEVDDGARIVEDAGRRAPWSSGVVGMYGGSYRGGTQLATATGPDRARLKPLKAVVVGAPVASAYEFFGRDGVPHLLQGAANVLAYSLVESHPEASPQHLAERPGCQPEILAGASDPSGDYTEHFAVRDHTRHLDRLTAATLMWHGHADTRVGAHMQIGLFDGIPRRVPKAGLFGVFEHEHPDAFRDGTPEPRAGWERSDWEAMTLAWYDRHLRGVRNGVRRWPVAQVQGTDGQWRTARDWPRRPGGLRRALLLGPDGTLGAERPAGSTTYLETPAPELTGGPGYPDGTAATFTTAPLPSRLELYGTPKLRLWVKLDRPDAHVAVVLEALEADGARTMPEARVVGARSMRHLGPFEDGRFRQRAGVDAPVGTPFRATVRLAPTDLVVPPGGRLRLTVTGSVQGFDGLDGVSEGAGAVIQGPTMPSGASPDVELLHSCAHPSALVVTTPGRGSRLLDVRERDDEGTLGDTPLERRPTVGGGFPALRGDVSC